ncbi:hypothetical protein [Radicibacter daui]|uniref:hypothetical protein n=1 Tax=Radicibacter daui TaxID=3064829 RepID=UPI0040468F33
MWIASFSLKLLADADREAARLAAARRRRAAEAHKAGEDKSTPAATSTPRQP